eukprot:366555-Chlamydomonas_euryale.AAC.14
MAREVSCTRRDAPPSQPTRQTQPLSHRTDAPEEGELQRVWRPEGALPAVWRAQFGHRRWRCSSPGFASHPCLAVRLAHCRGGRCPTACRPPVRSQVRGHAGHAGLLAEHAHCCVSCTHCPSAKQARAVGLRDVSQLPLPLLGRPKRVTSTAAKQDEHAAGRRRARRGDSQDAPRQRQCGTDRWALPPLSDHPCD